MENAYFLLSEFDEQGPTRQLLNSLSSSNVNAQVFVFVKDLKKAIECQRDYPSVLTICIDPTPNQFHKSAQSSLERLPEMDCFLNFSGEDFSRLLNDFGLYKGMTYRNSQLEQEEASLPNIARKLNKVANDGPVVINISQKKKDITSALKKKIKTACTSDNNFGPITFNISSRFLKRQQLSVNTRQPELSPERVPLLNDGSGSDEEEDNVETSFAFSSLWSRCLNLFCCFNSEDQAYEAMLFQNEQHLRCHIRYEQTKELRSKLTRLFKNSEKEWNKILERLTDEKEEKLEALRENVDEQKKNYQKEIDAKKSNTKKNFSGTSSEYLSPQIQNAHQNASDRKMTSEMKAKSGGIGKDFTIKVDAERATHYTLLLKNQFEILIANSDKFKRKFQTLCEQHFGRNA